MELVATALTVHGIETAKNSGFNFASSVLELQQHLPFTVLKPLYFADLPFVSSLQVATALTVHGIETLIIA